MFWVLHKKQIIQKHKHCFLVFGGMLQQYEFSNHVSLLFVCVCVSYCFCCCVILLFVCFMCEFFFGGGGFCACRASKARAQMQGNAPNINIEAILHKTKLGAFVLAAQSGCITTHDFNGLKHVLPYACV